MKCLCWRPEKNFHQQFGWLRSWLYPSARYGVCHHHTSPEHLSILQRLRKEFHVSLKLLHFPLHHNSRYSPPGLYHFIHTKLVLFATWEPSVVPSTCVLLTQIRYVWRGIGQSAESGKPLAQSFKRPWDSFPWSHYSEVYHWSMSIRMNGRSGGQAGNVMNCVWAGRGSAEEQDKRACRSIGLPSLA
jgi:hypothetical protein